MSKWDTGVHMPDRGPGSLGKEQEEEEHALSTTSLADPETWENRGKVPSLAHFKGWKFLLLLFLPPQRYLAGGPASSSATCLMANIGQVLNLSESLMN